MAKYKCSSEDMKGLPGAIKSHMGAKAPAVAGKVVIPAKTPTRVTTPTATKAGATNKAKSSRYGGV